MSANYLHLQDKPLLEACQKILKEKYSIAIEKVIQANTISNTFVPSKQINVMKNVKYR